MMEHNPRWQARWLNMVRLMHPAGLLVMSCATAGRRQHGTAQHQADASPLTVAAGQSHYRNLVRSDFEPLVHLPAFFAAHAFHTDHGAHDLYFFGVGREAEAAVVERARALAAAFDGHDERRNILGLG